jgi:hypothetical protein
VRAWLVYFLSWILQDESWGIREAANKFLEEVTPPGRIDEARNFFLLVAAVGFEAGEKCAEVAIGDRFAILQSAEGVTVFVHSAGELDMLPHTAPTAAISIDAGLMQTQLLTMVGEWQ